MDDSHEQKKTLLTSSHAVPFTSPSPAPSRDRKSQATKASRPHFFLTWYLELLACFGFVAAVVALFITIYQYRNKPSPDWPEWLSLNSIIAIYLVLLKACVLLVTAEGLGQLKWSWFATGSRPLYDIARFDSATRGPWGAATLLWRLKLKHLVASLGALVTLLTLLVDPAAQQIVHFSGCQIAMREMQASVPRTASWAGRGSRASQGSERIMPEVRMAIDAGVAGTFAPLRAECLTGNCTWTSEYDSLGWSGFCNDISEEIVRTNRTYIGGPANTTVWLANTTIPGGMTVNQTTDFSGLPYMNYAAMSGSPMNISKPAYSVALDFVFLGSGIHNGTDNIVTADPWEDCDDSIATTDRPWKCRGYGAARCYIFPSVKRYNASVQTGQLLETVTDADNSWGSEDGIRIHSLDTQCITDDERSKLLDLGYTFEPDRRWIAYNSTSENINLAQPLNDSFPDSLMRRGCQYVYWYPTIKSIQRELVVYFSGTISGIPAIVPGIDPSNLEGPQPLQTIFNFGDVSFERVNETISNLTQALDNHVRMTGDGYEDYNAPALGQVFEEKTCIRIRWAWMAYPAALVVLALLFFALMAVETRPRGVLQGDGWKSSPLALLYHGLVPEIPAGGLNWQMEGIKAMEVEAKRTVIRLGTSSGGRTGLEIQ